MMRPLPNLKGRRIAITGASRGFGRLLAGHVHAAGADVLLIARPSEGLAAACAALQADGASGQVEARALDITVPGDRAAAFAGEWKKIDVLVNNAAVQGPIGPLWKNDLDVWRAALELNLVAPVALAHAVLPAMVSRGSGAIVNLSGGGATGSRPGFTAYAAAKSALVRVTECLAGELQGTGVAVTAVAPGVMATDMLRQVVAAGALAAGAKEVIIANRALESAEEVSQAALDLCCFLCEAPRLHLSGKLIAAQWDPWDRLDPLAADLAGDIYTLRRIVPEDRGKDWTKL